MEIFGKNRNFSQKIAILEKMEILVKNRNFRQKIAILDKNGNSDEKSQF